MRLRVVGDVRMTTRMIVGVLPVTRVFAEAEVTVAMIMIMIIGVHEAGEAGDLDKWILMSKEKYQDGAVELLTNPETLMSGILKKPGKPAVQEDLHLKKAVGEEAVGMRMMIIGSADVVAGVSLMVDEVVEAAGDRYIVSVFIKQKNSVK